MMTDPKVALLLDESADIEVSVSGRTARRPSNGALESLK
jgi:hypothetical protein